MQVTAETRLRSDHLHEARTQLVRLDGGEADAMVRTEGEQRLHQADQRVPFASIAAVASQVRAREHDLREPGLEEPAGALQHLDMPEAPAPAAHVGHDAVGAEGIAALLDLEERPRPAHVQGRLAREAAGRASRAHAEEGRVAAVPRFLPWAPAHRAHQRFGIFTVGRAQHGRYARKGAHLFRGALGVASGHHDPRPRRLAVKPPEELPRLLVGAARDRAGVHHDHVRLPLPLLHSPGEKPPPEGRRVVLVQPAAQGPKRNPRGPGGPLGGCRDCSSHRASRTLPARRPLPRLPPGPSPRPRARPWIPPRVSA